MGNSKHIHAGEAIFSKWYSQDTTLKLYLTASDIDLTNNRRYKVTCVVAMDSGLTASGSTTFTVSWSEEMVAPNADIGYDTETCRCIIRPFCRDKNGVLLKNTWLSVYRRNYDGEFIEIATEINNAKNIYVTDLHPSLDVARYRIVAMSKTTGAVSYHDVARFVNEKAIIIQWDEAWEPFEISEEDGSQLEDRSSDSSMVRLPYNIDVSNNHSNDVSLVEYIGRKRPVSYYGTQLGETATWKVEIPKTDKETLYAIRRLAVYNDNVYIREPSGSGYWATISVSYTQTHCELTIPISFDITRVDGGE